MAGDHEDALTPVVHGLGYFGELAQGQRPGDVVGLHSRSIPTPETRTPNMIMSLSVPTPHCYFVPGDTNVFTGREELRGQLRMFHNGNFFWCLCLYR